MLFKYTALESMSEIALIFQYYKSLASHNSGAELILLSSNAGLIGLDINMQRFIARMHIYTNFMNLFVEFLLLHKQLQCSVSDDVHES